MSSHRSALVLMLHDLGAAERHTATTPTTKHARPNPVAHGAGLESTWRQWGRTWLVASGCSSPVEPRAGLRTEPGRP